MEKRNREIGTRVDVETNAQYAERGITRIEKRKIKKKKRKRKDRSAN